MISLDGSNLAGREGNTYAPFSQEETASTQRQASELLTLLQQFAAHRALDPFWGAKFWRVVASWPQPLAPNILNLLRGHGFIGAGTAGPPRLEELEKSLQGLSGSGSPPHGSAAGLLAAGPTQTDAGMLGATDTTAWDQRLPPDIKRAGAEIYRKMRSSGASSARAWLQTQFTGDKRSQIWVDLWHGATAIDFRLAQCADDEARTVALAGDDMLEINLRRLAAYVYFNRTRDNDGAQHMLALAAPGAECDLAPSWLVSESTAHSKAEYQRTERVKALNRLSNKGDKGGGKDPAGGGKGRGKSQGRGKKSSSNKGSPPGAAASTHG